MNLGSITAWRKKLIRDQWYSKNLTLFCSCPQEPPESTKNWKFLVSGWRIISEVPVPECFHFMLLHTSKLLHFGGKPFFISFIWYLKSVVTLQVQGLITLALKLWNFVAILSNWSNPWIHQWSIYIYTYISVHVFHVKFNFLIFDIRVYSVIVLPFEEAWRVQNEDSYKSFACILPTSVLVEAVPQKRKVAGVEANLSFCPLTMAANSLSGDDSQSVVGQRSMVKLNYDSLCGFRLSNLV